MNTYIMSDLHGCYDDLQRMLAKINFSSTDQLILAGDCIDRGRQSYEMLKWIENAPANVQFIRGNHEEEFATYVYLMCQLDQKEHLETDFSSAEDAILLYETTKYFVKYMEPSVSYFDLYGTIENLLYYNAVTLDDLCRWADIIRTMPYHCKRTLSDKTYIAVHAGYAENLADIEPLYSSLEQFYLYAREQSLWLGGKPHTAIIAGHTPTILKDHFAYNCGNVFRYTNPTNNCTYFDIDCGCVFRSYYRNAKLACLRLEDEACIYC